MSWNDPQRRGCRLNHIPITQTSHNAATSAATSAVTVPILPGLSDYSNMLVTVATRLDLSGGSVVVWCTECPSWRELRGTATAAAACRVEHERLVHGQFRGPAARFADRHRPVVA